MSTNDETTDASRNLWAPVLSGVVVLAILGAIIGAAVLGSTQSTAVEGPAAPVARQKTAATPQPVALKEKPAKARKRSNVATDDNEPHVKARGSVVVDTQKWRIVSARTKRRIGNDFLRETADGVYVLVKLRVSNHKDKSVTLTSSQLTYEVAGKEYATDSDGSTTLTLTSDAETFILKDLGPDVATTGVVAFDVPRATLKQRPEICFGDLVGGWKKGCIRLPSPASRATR